MGAVIDIVLRVHKIEVDQESKLYKDLEKAQRQCDIDNFEYPSERPTVPYATDEVDHSRLLEVLGIINRYKREQKIKKILK